MTRKVNMERLNVKQYEPYGKKTLKNSREIKQNATVHRASRSPMGISEGEHNEAQVGNIMVGQKEESERET